ncbi:Vacuolar protein sorting-associated protein 11 -like protein [Trametes pubescens]|uniref:Vacuolar protein sorting-associated protein 11-like protein n=1 Tax=Trametes pubescens TaxID=154538 RepID=A0A1M2VRB8_TRAPU|nr:Vacuolar protein sorting-associated protein 11 -like protein [Trametes pubescens]
MGMQEDVLRFFMDRDQEGDAGASAEVVRRLDQYGPGRPQLYPLVLRFLTSTPALLAKHREDVRRVLRVIDEEKLMPPVSVVQVLSRNSVASVGLVKEWLMSRIKSAREEVDTDQKLIASYRTETEAKLRQVEELSDPDHPRVFHVTQCSACQGGLDLPAVHFMCNHSYHQRCLPQNETECPNCAREHGIIREIRRNNERLADQHELFLSEVREGGFDALSTGFSRGVLNLSRVEEAGSS